MKANEIVLKRDWSAKGEVWPEVIGKLADWPWNQAQAVLGAVANWRNSGWWPFMDQFEETGIAVRPIGVDNGGSDSFVLHPIANGCRSAGQSADDALAALLAWHQTNR